MKRFALVPLALSAAIAAAPAVAADVPVTSVAPARTGTVYVPPALPAPLTGPLVGSPAPDFNLKTIDGRTVSLADYRGKTLVINVWATWCPPCRQEMPDLISSYPKLQKTGVEFLGVDSTELAPIVRAYASAKGLPYAQAIDSDQSFATAYDVQYFPTTYVVDAKGILRARYVDVISPAELVTITDTAKQGKNFILASPLQTKIDALLSDASLTFEGDPATIVAQAKKASEVVDKAEGMLDDSDASTGNPVDLLRTHSEEAALRDRAIAALAPVASTDADKILLAKLRGDAAADREKWTVALENYQAVLALDPKNEDALGGVALAAGRLKQYSVAIDADQKIVALDPTSVSALVDLGLTYAATKQFDDSYATFAKATALAQQQLDAKPHDAHALRILAWAHVYAGRSHVKGGDPAGARKEFEATLAAAQQLPANDSRHDMYLEEGQEAIVALGLTGDSATALSLAPWTGAELPGSVPNTIKYRLVVSGAAGKSVALHTAGVPKGWVASFCTDRVCAPFKVSINIPASGVKIIEFQLVPPGANASPGKVQVIGTDGGATATATT